MRSLLLALAMLPSMAAAQAPQQPAAQTGRDVVVTARPKVEGKQARAFARSASAPVENQLPRFMSLACPRAFGFSPALASRIEARMRDVVDAARAPLAGPGCKANMIVMAVDDGAQALREMKRLDTPLILPLQGPEVERLIRTPGPVRSWTATVLRNEDGIEQSKPVGGTGPATMPVYHDWLMAPGGQQTIGLAVVLIDWSALYGKSPDQIADYAAMRTLARTRPVSGIGAVESILALFDPDTAPPRSMTATDLAYLKALYHDPRPYYARTQIEDMAHGVRTASTAARRATAAPAPPTPPR